MNETIKSIMERRSIRKFKQEQITDEELNLILKAGTYAPCAGGMQFPVMVVLQKKDVIEQLGKVNRKIFFETFTPGNLTVSKAQPSIIDDNKITSAFYGAPTLITVFAPKTYPDGAQDGSALIQNMLLAAYSLGIGACFIARAAETFATEAGKEIVRDWNVSEEYIAVGHCILGYPEGALPAAKPRKEFIVRRIK